MKIATLLLALALSLCASVALAHALLKKSTPADGSVISAAPSHIELTFSEAARLTAAWIQKGDGAKQKLGALAQTAAIKVEVALPALEPGTYVVSWRALSDDGHIMPGQIHFTLAAPAANQPTPSQPLRH